MGNSCNLICVILIKTIAASQFRIMNGYELERNGGIAIVTSTDVGGGCTRLAEESGIVITHLWKKETK